MKHLVEDNGAPSNPQVALEVQKVHELAASILMRRPRRGESRIPRRNGAIVTTVESLLAETGEALTAGQIHAACLEQVGRVPLATIEDLLWKHARTERIVRIRRGLYASRSSGLVTIPPLNRTVAEVLTTAGRPMSLGEIHARCQAVLRIPVRYSAVKSSAARLVLQGRLERAGHGVYAAYGGGNATDRR